MKKTNCFKSLFYAVREGFYWLFNSENGWTFGKVVKRFFIGCAAVLLLLFTSEILYRFTVDVVYEKWIEPKVNNYFLYNNYLSDNIVLKVCNYSNSIHDLDGNREILDDVDWVYTSSDGDSLAVFARHGKRGYINRFTGEIAIPETYSRAWVFSEGLAAVEKDGRLVFIDHSGKVVIDKNFRVDRSSDKDYVFNKGYCVVHDYVSDKFGLIDHYGNWALAPAYYDIYNTNGFWQVEKEEFEGLYTAELKEMFPVEYGDIIVEDDAIEVRLCNHTAKRYDYEGNVLVDFVIDDVSNLKYATTELRNDLESVMYDEYGNDVSDPTVYAVANCQRYTVCSGHRYGEEYYGLLNRDGHRVTPPLYTYITAIGKNLYLCQPDGIIINDKGEIIK